jgi:predicted 3-demethylubiquinone-9 3-methyltransferase (glyoxalase superfamily)
MKKITPCLWFENNSEEAERAVQALFKMKKIDISALERAISGN